MLSLTHTSCSWVSQVISFGCLVRFPVVLIFYFGKSVQNKWGIWSPCCAAEFVKEGQCSGRKSPGKVQSLAAARAPL